MFEAIWRPLRELLSSEEEVGSARDWTTQVKDRVVNAVDREKLSWVMCHGTNRPNREAEYLVDLAIAARCEMGDGPTAFDYSGLDIALECEWNLDPVAIEYDFCKLADIRATTKVFVCSSRENEWQHVDDRLLARFCAFLQHHRHVPKGEQFLVVVSAEGPLQKTGVYAKAWILTKGAAMTTRAPFEVGN